MYVQILYIDRLSLIFFSDSKPQYSKFQYKCHGKYIQSQLSLRSILISSLPYVCQLLLDSLPAHQYLNSMVGGALIRRICPLCLTSVPTQGVFITMMSYLNTCDLLYSVSLSSTVDFSYILLTFFLILFVIDFLMANSFTLQLMEFFSITYMCYFILIVVFFLFFSIFDL